MIRREDSYLKQPERKSAFNEKFKRFKEVCQQSGIRLTPQRLEIFRELAHNEEHPSAEDIFKRIKRRIPTVSFDTVYRTLSTFERCGIIRRVQVLDDRGRFDANLKWHHHLVCTRCKRITDFYWPNFDNMGIPDDVGGWGKIKTKHAELRGLCQECAPKERRQRRKKSTAKRNSA
jgi:Fur family peroxide stress response transcriptional regulator